MTCYQVSQGGELIALVTTLGLAQAIEHCQPPGYYRVDLIQVEPPIAKRHPLNRKHRIAHFGRRRRVRAGWGKTPGGPIASASDRGPGSLPAGADQVKSEEGEILVAGSR